jgi:hypothetical protein
MEFDFFMLIQLPHEQKQALFAILRTSLALMFIYFIETNTMLDANHTTALKLRSQKL